MEPLSNILKVLYIRNSGEILHSLFSPCKKFYADRVIDKDYIAHQLVHCGLYSTLDQAMNEADLLEDKWMKGDNKYHMLRFSKETTVFNTLLHFSASRLKLKDGEPICNYDQLLSWDELTKVLGEDLFVTSYVASREIAERRPRIRSFNWDICLKNDAGDLSSILERPMVDIHAHLKGSSANFEISWICLMNHISRRATEFKVLSRRKLMPDIVIDYKDASNSLYSTIIKAAAIRIYLFLHLNNYRFQDRKTAETLQKIISRNCHEIYFYINELQDILDLVNFLIEEKSGNSCPVLDYAIPEVGRYVISQISGERRFLYQCFKAIYLDQFRGKNSNLSTLFYYYLVAKEELRKELNQVNQCIGFSNFQEYQNRKSVFLWKYPRYDNLMVQMAISNYMDHYKVGNRYMEPRIAPKSTVSGLDNALYEQDRAIMCQTFTDDDTSHWRYDYVCHFIKNEDNSLYLSSEILGFLPRHFDLRNKVKRQATALFELRSNGYLQAQRIVGIDAANSEIACRPEVFAHAFRFLNSNKTETQHNDSFSCILPNLGRTYHVGEDFYSIVDGLRAVDEVFRFLHFGNGDRLGHALVLGTDVHKYYRRRHFCINAKTLTIVDNLAWLYVKVCRCGCSSAIAQYLKESFRKVCTALYSNTGKQIPEIDDYYQSWLLRGDEPNLYKVSYSLDDKEEKTWDRTVYHAKYSISLWDSTGLNYGFEFEDARKNRRARIIYHDYHYNSTIKRNGNQAYLFKVKEDIREDFLMSIARVQDKLLKEVENRHVAIECNPSSNLKIGDFERYEEHPITKFNNVGLSTPYDVHDISVSINTDDSGVFSTTLEREYSLVALSLEKCKIENFQNSPRTILSWLDNIRLMGHEQKFVKEERLYNNSSFCTLSKIDKNVLDYFKNKERYLIIRL